MYVYIFMYTSCLDKFKICTWSHYQYIIYIYIFVYTSSRSMPMLEKIEYPTIWTCSFSVFFVGCLCRYVLGGFWIPERSELLNVLNLFVKTSHEGCFQGVVFFPWDCRIYSQKWWRIAMDHNFCGAVGGVNSLLVLRLYKSTMCLYVYL